MRAVTLKLLAAAGLAAMATVSAQAADLPIAPPEPPPLAPAYVPAYNWSGFHVGLHAGYGWGEAENTISASFAGGAPFASADVDAFDVDGGLAGGQVGYDFQFGNFVVGAEADISWSGMEGEIDLIPGVPGGVNLGHDINWLGTARARAGFALDRFLVYATGGLAFADVETSVDIPALPYDNTDSQTQFGWTVGAGVEAFITPNLTAKVEYLYVDLGEEDYNLFSGPAGFPLSVDTETSLTSHVVRGGINYKFSW